MAKKKRSRSRQQTASSSSTQRIQLLPTPITLQQQQKTSITPSQVKSHLGSNSSDSVTYQTKKKLLNNNTTDKGIEQQRRTLEVLSTSTQQYAKYKNQFKANTQKESEKSMHITPKVIVKQKHSIQTTYNSGKCPWAKKEDNDDQHPTQSNITANENKIFKENKTPVSSQQFIQSTQNSEKYSCKKQSDQKEPIETFENVPDNAIETSPVLSTDDSSCSSSSSSSQSSFTFVPPHSHDLEINKYQSSTQKNNLETKILQIGGSKQSPLCDGLTTESHQFTPQIREHQQQSRQIASNEEQLSHKFVHQKQQQSQDVFSIENGSLSKTQKGDERTVQQQQKQEQKINNLIQSMSHQPKKAVQQHYKNVDSNEKKKMHQYNQNVTSDITLQQNLNVTSPALHSEDVQHKRQLIHSKIPQHLDNVASHMSHVQDKYQQKLGQPQTNAMTPNKYMSHQYPQHVQYVSHQSNASSSEDIKMQEQQQLLSDKLVYWAMCNFCEASPKDAADFDIEGSFARLRSLQCYGPGRFGPNNLKTNSYYRI